MEHEKKRVSGKEFLSDFRAGMDDRALCAKYELTNGQLKVVYHKLIDRNQLTAKDVSERLVQDNADAKDHVSQDPLPIHHDLPPETEACPGSNDGCDNLKPQPIRLHESFGLKLSTRLRIFLRASLTAIRREPFIAFTATMLGWFLSHSLADGWPWFTGLLLFYGIASFHTIKLIDSAYPLERKYVLGAGLVLLAFNLLGFPILRSLKTSFSQEKLWVMFIIVAVAIVIAICAVGQFRKSRAKVEAQRAELDNFIRSGIYNEVSRELLDSMRSGNYSAQGLMIKYGMSEDQFSKCCDQFLHSGSISESLCLTMRESPYCRLGGRSATYGQSPVGSGLNGPPLTASDIGKEETVEQPMFHRDGGSNGVNNKTVIICVILCLLTVVTVVIITSYSQRGIGRPTEASPVVPRESFTDCRARCEDRAGRAATEKTSGVYVSGAYELFYRTEYQACMEKCR